MTYPKRIAAMFLSVLMLFTAIPEPVLAAETEEKEYSFSFSAIPEGKEAPNSQELEELYQQKIFYPEKFITPASSAVTPLGLYHPDEIYPLSPMEQEIHAVLTDFTEEIARNGGTAFVTLPRDLKIFQLSSRSSSELHTNISAMVRKSLRALYNEHRENFYWSPYASGNARISYTERDGLCYPTFLRVTFDVDPRYCSEDPSLSEDVQSRTVDPQKAQRPMLARNNALAAAEKIRRMTFTDPDGRDYGQPILGKLRAAKNAICDLNRYNREALDPNYTGVMYDTQHMVDVFDGDPNTNVVCAGYASAYQYLCDLVFEPSEAQCIYVTGYLNGELHAWNIVRTDAQNYFADVTACDAGGSTSEGYFMRCPDDGWRYRFEEIVPGKSYKLPWDTYEYEESTLSRYSPELLTLTHGSAPTTPVVPLDQAHFPDAALRRVAAGFDTDNSGDLSPVEVFSVGSITAHGCADLTGIGVFSNLSHLDVSHGTLKTLDLQQVPHLITLHCADNQLTDLHVRDLPYLEVLDCSDNHLSYLDTNRNGRLKDLDCSGNVFCTTEFQQISLPRGFEVSQVIDSTLQGGFVDNNSLTLDAGSSAVTYRYLLREGVSETFTIRHTHSQNTQWYHDARSHWHQCQCGLHTDEAPHTYRWQVDLPATPALPGSHHQVCTVCGYARPSEEIPPTGPVAPEVRLANLTSTGSPNLTWTAVPGADAYQIWCREGKNGSLEWLRTTSEIHFLHEAAAPGITYHYQVCTVVGGVAGPLSQDRSCTADCAQPQLAVSKRSDGKPILTWNKIAGAAEYRILASEDGGDFTYLTTIQGTRLNHSSAEYGHTYAYKVQAICAVPEANSAESEPVEIELLAPQLLPAPALTVTNRASTGKPYLKWTPVDGAAKYEIYRSTSREGTFTRLTATSGTGIQNGSTTAGKTYYYKVRAIAADGMEGEFSAVKSRTCDLPQPKLTVTLRSGKPYLSWEAVSGAVKYEVYRSVNGGEFVRFYTTSGTRLTNGSASAGNTYAYQVRAICSNKYGNSAFSEPQQVTLDAVKLGVPTLTVTNKSSTGKPYLKWTAVDGAQKYEIYRAACKSGTYTRLTTTGGTRLTNSSATAGKTYYYKVRAIGADGTVGDFSAIKTRTCDLARPDVKLSTRNGHPYLYWKSVSGAVRYEVYCSVDGGSFTRLLSVKGTKLTHSSAKRGHTYRYRVKAIASKSSANSAYSYYDTITVK